MKCAYYTNSCRAFIHNSNLSKNSNRSGFCYAKPHKWTTDNFRTFRPFSNGDVVVGMVRGGNHSLQWAYKQTSSQVGPGPSSPVIQFYFARKLDRDKVTFYNSFSKILGVKVTIFLCLMISIGSWRGFRTVSRQRPSHLPTIFRPLILLYVLFSSLIVWFYNSRYFFTLFSLLSNILIRNERI